MDGKPRINLVGSLARPLGANRVSYRAANRTTMIAVLGLIRRHLPVIRLVRRPADFGSAKVLFLGVPALSWMCATARITAVFRRSMLQHRPAID
jgi:hypothetical protein